MFRIAHRARVPRTAFVGAALAAFALPAAAPAVADDAPSSAQLRPAIDAITCRSTCQAIDAAVPGSVVQISGPNMGAVTQVVLLGRRGARDDKVAAAQPTSGMTAVFVVPDGARTGPVRAVTNTALRSPKSSRRLLIGRPSDGPRPGADLQARADIRRVVTGVNASVSFFVRTDQPQDVAVDVLRGGTSVAHWDLPQVAGRSVTTVVWQVPTDQQVEGRYTWRVLTKAQYDAASAQTPTRAGGGAAAPDNDPVTAKAATAGPSFYVVRHVFPIVGKHTYSMGAGRFGTGRNGHTHQGQDVFADCGTPLVAVTGGTIKYNGFQSAAGNYIVLAGDDGTDYAYMHLREPSPVKKGDAVTGGQFVGHVGDTGDAQGCHLHFEVWPAPGWYTGGSPVDPLPYLKSWDS